MQPNRFLRVPSERSFLATAGEMSAHLERASSSGIEATDQTSSALAFLDENVARTKSLGGPAPLGLHLLLGPTFEEMITGLRRNLTEGRLAATFIHARKN